MNIWWAIGLILMALSVGFIIYAVVFLVQLKRAGSPQKLKDKIRKQMEG